MMVAPFVLAVALGGAFLGLLGYVHHDGDARGYRRHEMEVAEAIRATNNRIAVVNAQAAEAIAKAERDRDAAFDRANAQVITVPANCALPEPLRLEINRISRK